LDNKSFRKYNKHGAYHWKQISWSIKHRDARTVARYRKIIELVKGNLPKGENLLCVDLGAGECALSNLLCKELPKNRVRFMAIEMEKEAVEIAKQMVPHIDVRLGDVTNTGLEDGTAAILVSSEVIEHLNNPDAMVAEAKRILMPGGIFVLSTPVRISEKPKDSHHIKEFFPEEFKVFLHNYFDYVEIHLINPLSRVERYRSKCKFGPIRISSYKYIYNFMDIYLGINPFLQKAPEHFPLYLTMVALCKKPRL
jgi:2-polyprenyl-3-methyl-5-hydroxy-6-metoxy-1,4-benzoquinol methylase